MGTLKLSIVIPTFREAHRIAEAVDEASREADEVIVSDASSDDGTAERARRAGARVLTAPKGRGSQLQAGVLAARGDVLLFLHADTRLPRGAREAVREALADPRILGGNFRIAFEPATPVARLYAWAYNLRSRLLRIYYGDSAIFLRRAAYEALGGFRQQPLFEDYDLMRRLERMGRTAYLSRHTVVTSARRFEHTPLRTLALWIMLQTLYSLGVSAERLARFYSDIREGGTSGRPLLAPSDDGAAGRRTDR